MCRQIGIWAAISSLVFVTICLAGAPDDARSHIKSPKNYPNFISTKTTQLDPVAPDAAQVFGDNLNFSSSSTICLTDTAADDRRPTDSTGIDNYFPSGLIFESIGSPWDFLSTKELSLGVNLSVSLPLTTSPCVKTEAPKNSFISGIINFSYTSTQTDVVIDPGVFNNNLQETPPATSDLSAAGLDNVGNGDNLQAIISVELNSSYLGGGELKFSSATNLKISTPIYPTSSAGLRPPLFHNLTKLATIQQRPVPTKANATEPHPLTFTQSLGVTPSTITATDTPLSLTRWPGVTLFAFSASDTPPVLTRC